MTQPPGETPPGRPAFPGQPAKNQAGGSRRSQRPGRTHFSKMVYRSANAVSLATFYLLFALIPASIAAAHDSGDGGAHHKLNIIKRAPRFNLIHFQKPRPMPDLTLPDLDGKPVRLTEPKGKVILLNFWATWCPPCLEEMPSMEKLHRRFRGRPFEVIAVSVDKGGVELVRQFIKKRKFTFRVLHDAEGKTETPFGLRGLPISYVVNHRGQLIAGAIGAKNWRSKKAYAYFKGLLRKIENN